MYSSGPTRYVTTRRERRSEQIRLCVQEDIYLCVCVCVQVCASQPLFVSVREHLPPAPPELIRLFMREARGGK